MSSMDKARGAEFLARHFVDRAKAGDIETARNLPGWIAELMRENPGIPTPYIEYLEEAGKLVKQGKDANQAFHLTGKRGPKKDLATHWAKEGRYFEAENMIAEGRKAADVFIELGERDHLSPKAVENDYYAFKKGYDETRRFNEMESGNDI